MTFVHRIEQLRLKTGMNWLQVAGALGVSRTHLHLMRKGDYEPSPKVMLRLEQAEVNAGLRKPPGEKSGILRLLESIPVSRQTIGVKDHEAGVVDVPVDFRSGSAPKDFEGTVPVRAPDASVAAKLLAGLLLDEDPEAYLQHCLPPQFACSEFLNKLDPVSFLRLLDAAMELTLGAKWREKLPGLAEQLKKQGSGLSE